MNKHLKEIGKWAQMNDTVLKVRTSGNNRIQNRHHKHYLIITHTARRSLRQICLKEVFLRE